MPLAFSISYLSLTLSSRTSKAGASTPSRLTPSCNVTRQYSSEFLNICKSSSFVKLSAKSFNLQDELGPNKESIYLSSAFALPATSSKTYPALRKISKSSLLEPSFQLFS